jgi:hypothetical protein
MESDTPQRPTLSIRAESLTKLGLSIAGLAYILGFAVVALHSRNMAYPRSTSEAPTQVQFILKKDVADTLTSTQIEWLSQERFLLTCHGYNCASCGPIRPREERKFSLDIQHHAH